MGRLLIVYDSALSSNSALGPEGSLDETIQVLSDLLLESERELYLFFKRATGGLEPWGAQRAWIKRLLRGENTVLVAPTGIGKTTLLLVYALFSAARGKKVLYVVPTRSLGDQVSEKLSEMSKLSGSSVRVLYYSSTLRGKKREAVLSSISSGDFDILVVTSAFLRRLREVCSHRFSVVIVDDADSLVKSERSVYVLLDTLGYTREDIELSKRRVELSRRILVDKVTGRDATSLVKELVEVDSKLESSLRARSPGQLVVASATCYTRGLAGRILRDLLKVDISGITIYGRDVLDAYTLVDSVDDAVRVVVEIVSKLGRGGILYISPRNPAREVFLEVSRRLLDYLSKQGFRASDASPRAVQMLVSGELDFLIGYSSYYSSSVRGIDSPRNIRYVVFLGTPVFSIPLENFLANPALLVRVVYEVANLTQSRELLERAARARRQVLLMSPLERKLVKYCLLGKIPESAIQEKTKTRDLYIAIKELYEAAVPLVKALIDRKKTVAVGTITLIKAGDKYLAVIPDLMTYIQATGRTSRLLGDKMTHGFSLLVELREQENFARGLDLKFKALDRDLGLRHISEVDLDYERKLLDSTRSLACDSGKLKYKSTLIVVESPTKARTIARFFGKPVVRRIAGVSLYTIPARVGDEVVEFNVVSTRGHIYELTTRSNVGIFGVEVGKDYVKPVYTTIKRCKICGAQFTDSDYCPKCGSGVYTDSKLVVQLLRNLSLEVDEVYIATDPDIEGEKIAYDVYSAISPFNQNIWRIELHEITRSELLATLSRKRSINLKLVEAEVYRRVLDRLVGFSLSERLQKAFNSRNLGIGRVQGPLLDFIVKRYYEYLANKCKKVCVSSSDPVKLTVCTCVNSPELVEKLRSASSIELVKTSDYLVEVSPRPPYTTEDLLVDASSRLGLQAEVTMKLAQELYEAGLITYHRTDCSYISNTGITVARTYLREKGLESYFTPRRWSEPGSHEAIRPVNPYDAEQLLRAAEEGLIQLVIPLTPRHLSLYDLVFKRFIASQMKPYRALKSKYRIYVNSVELGELEVLVDVAEHGFDLVDKPRLHCELRGVEKTTLPVNSTRVFNSSRVPLYTEGDLVSLMKTHGIGRPSTYSKVISNLKRHGYVVLSKSRHKAIPTKRGIMVYKYLAENYSSYMSVELTRRMERSIDAIIRGELEVYDAVVATIVDLVEKSALIPLELPSDFYSYIALQSPSYGLAPNSNTI
jgi:reverse gyrase